jgi:tetratricopeptide (TPR) repeat protein
LRGSGKPSDLEQAIIHLRRSVHISSSDDRCLPNRLNNLGLSLQSRFEFDDKKNFQDPSWSHSKSVNEAKDLEDAIQTFRKAVEQTNTPHPEWIANLGTAYRLKAEKEQDITVLKKAISFLQAAVDLFKDSPSMYHDFSSEISREACELPYRKGTSRSIRSRSH